MNYFTQQYLYKYKYKYIHIHDKRKAFLSRYFNVEGVVH